MLTHQQIADNIINCYQYSTGLKTSCFQAALLAKLPDSYDIRCYTNDSITFVYASCNYYLSRDNNSNAWIITNPSR